MLPDGRLKESSMKNMFLAALAALSLNVAVLPAFAVTFHNSSTIAGDRAATRMQQTGSYAGGGN
jgi:hypothetical protein